MDAPIVGVVEDELVVALSSKQTVETQRVVAPQHEYVTPRQVPQNAPAAEHGGGVCVALVVVDVVPLVVVVVAVAVEIVVEVAVVAVAVVVVTVVSVAVVAVAVVVVCVWDAVVVDVVAVVAPRTKPPPHTQHA